jgi:hypothetical protein
MVSKALLTTAVLENTGEVVLPIMAALMVQATILLLTRMLAAIGILMVTSMEHLIRRQRYRPCEEMNP